MRRAIHLLLIGCIAMTLGASCGKKAQRKEASADILGRPPTPAEDPFFYVARPPVEAKAETRGTIGDAEPRPRREAKDISGMDADALRRELKAAQAARDAAEAQNIELRARNLELQAGLGPSAAKAKASSDPQCHACVRLCPVRGNCSDDAELVCGWGTGRSKKDAMLRATTECDGALEYIRATGTYERVEGKCPVATCN